MNGSLADMWLIWLTNFNSNIYFFLIPSLTAPTIYYIYPAIYNIYPAFLPPLEGVVWLCSAHNNCSKVDSPLKELNPAQSSAMS